MCCNPYQVGTMTSAHVFEYICGLKKRDEGKKMGTFACRFYCQLISCGYTVRRYVSYHHLINRVSCCLLACLLDIYIHIFIQYNNSAKVIIKLQA